jgi:ribose transport system permease protein
MSPLYGSVADSMSWLRGEATRTRVAHVLRDYGIVVVCILLFSVLSIVQDAFLTEENIKNVASQNAPLAIVAVATTIPIITGGFDLSLGATYALAGITAAWLAVNLDPTAGIILGILLGLAIGVGNGLLITGLRINSFLATLATGLIIRALAVLYSGGFLIQVEAEGFRTLGLGHFLGLEIATWVFIGFALILGIVLARSAFGRYVYAVGGNPEAARLSGVRISAVRVGAFAISGLGAGLAGVIGASRIGQGQTDVGVGIELTAIAAVVVGGTSILGGSGAIWRTVFGIALLAMITNGFNLFGISPVYSDIMTGGIIIVAIALQGIGRLR